MYSSSAVETRMAANDVGAMVFAASIHAPAPSLPRRRVLASPTTATVHRALALDEGAALPSALASITGTRLE
jgi:hypothetical protein